MKLRILNQFGNLLPLESADSIKFQFPYENGHVLEKTNAKVVTGRNYNCEIELDDFEIQGLAIGEKQNFLAEVKFGDEIHHVLFQKALNIELKNDRKVLK